MGLEAREKLRTRESKGRKKKSARGSMISGIRSEGEVNSIVEVMPCEMSDRRT